MAHQRFIFQESECWCPLKEDDKVDDGFGKLAFWKPKSNLTQAQNELSAFTLIFLIFFYDLALRTFNTAYVAASMNLRK